MDRNRQPGRFLLTGSADILLLPNLADSLAGRLEILTLWPFSQGEIEGHRAAFIDTLFSDTQPPLASASETRAQLVQRVVHGGYSEILQRVDRRRQRAFFDLVIEDDSGRLVGVETKASATVRADDFKGLHALVEQAGGRFHRGVVLYGGRECVAFGVGLFAMPVEALWRIGGMP